MKMIHEPRFARPIFQLLGLGSRGSTLAVSACASGASRRSRAALLVAER